MVGQGLGNLHHLLLGHRQPLDLGSGVDVQLPLVQEQALAGLPADEDVLRHRQVLHQVQLLVDDADALALRVPGPVNFDLLAEILNGAPVLLVDAGENFHQGGLARPILSHQGHHFSGPHLQVRVVQRVDAGEVFLDAVHFKDHFTHSSSSLPISNKTRPAFTADTCPPVFPSFCINFILYF